MKVNILVIYSILTTVVLAQSAKQTYIIGLPKGAILSTAIDAILKLVSTVTDPVAAPSASQQWSAGNLIGFTAVLSPDQVKLLQGSPLVSNR